MVETSLIRAYKACNLCSEHGKEAERAKKANELIVYIALEEIARDISMYEATESLKGTNYRGFISRCLSCKYEPLISRGLEENESEFKKLKGAPRK
jgi:hypothetical protein